MKRFLAQASVVLYLFAQSGQAHAHRVTKAHTHGQGSLSLVQVGKKLQLELEIPLADVVGFEHAARNAAESELLKQALSEESYKTSLQFNAEAQCKLERVTAMTNATKSHEPKKGHEHEHKGHEHEHSELRVSFELSCEQPERLRTLKCMLLESLPKLAKLDFPYILELKKGSGQETLTKETPLFSFES